jgi:hypothetical protein
MEDVDIIPIFYCSLLTKGICYTKVFWWYGQQTIPKGDIGGALSPEISATKLECIGHVQNRMGARLKRLVKEVGTELQNGETPGSQGHLTKSEIDELENYYHLAIRKNVSNLKGKNQTVWTVISTSSEQLLISNIILVCDFFSYGTMAHI